MFLPNPFSAIFIINVVTCFYQHRKGGHFSINMSKYNVNKQLLRFNLTKSCQAGQVAIYICLHVLCVKRKMKHIGVK